MEIKYYLECTKSPSASQLFILDSNQNFRMHLIWFVLSLTTFCSDKQINLKSTSIPWKFLFLDWKKFEFILSSRSIIGTCNTVQVLRKIRQKKLKKSSSLLEKSIFQFIELEKREILKEKKSKTTKIKLKVLFKLFETEKILTKNSFSWFSNHFPN